MKTPHKIKKIIEKNFKLLVRSKSSALIVVLGPLILILLVGLAFSNTDEYHILIGVYSQEYSELTESLIEKMSEENYIVTKEIAEELCIDKVKTGESNVCVIFPKNLEIKQDTPQDVSFHVDYSDINLVYNILDVISSKIGAQSKEISENLASDLLDRFQVTESEINARVPTVVKLTTYNDKLATSNDQLYNDLDKLDLSISLEKENVEKLQNEIDFLKTLAYDSIITGEELIEDLDSAVSKLSGNKSRAEYLLDKGEDDFAAFKTDLSDTNRAMNNSLGGLTADLAVISTKLSTANSVRNRAKESIDTSKEQLGESLNMLNLLQTSLNNIKKTITTIEIKDAAKIVNPITTKIVPITNKKTHFNYLFPLLIVLVIMITGILLGSTLVMVEKKSRSFFRNHITPTKSWVFFLATYLTGMILIFSQIVVFILIASVFFKTNIFSSFFSTLLILLLTSSLFIFLGMLIGTLFKSEETTTLASITVASIFMFFSNTILPMESMPLYFKKIAEFNPFVIGSELLKKALFFDLGVSQLISDIFWILAFMGLFVGLIFYVQEKNKAQTYSHMHKKGGLERLKTKLGKKWQNVKHVKEKVPLTSTVQKIADLKSSKASISLRPDDPLEKQLMTDSDFTSPEKKLSNLKNKLKEL